VVVAAFALLAWMYHVATSDPVVRTATLSVNELAAPVRLTLVSDIHVAGPDMPPSRVRRIVDQINALHPDVIILAGDFVSDKKLSTHEYTVAEAIAPLAALKARLGVIAERKRRGEVAPPLGPVPSRLPVRPDRAREPERAIGVPARHKVIERCPHVRLLGVETLEPRPSLTRPQLRARTLGEHDVPGCVSIPE